MALSDPPKEQVDPDEHNVPVQESDLVQVSGLLVVVQAMEIEPPSLIVTGPSEPLTVKLTVGAITQA